MSQIKPLGVFKHILNVTSALLITVSSMGTALLVPVSATAANNNTHPVCAPSVGCNYASLQAEVDTATAGDTLYFAGDATLSHSLIITRPLIIEGNGHKLSSPFEKTDNSNNAALAIITSDVTVNNLIIDGTGGLNLHGINIYVANHVVLNNVETINNGRSGVVVNGSTVTVNNITTANNGWSGIDVDLGSGVTSPAVLTVTGHSSQAETAVPQIKIDDTRKTANVVDQNNQYDVVNSENVRVYTIKPVPVPACSASDTTFDTFNNGSVNGQKGWASTGPFDQAIVPNTYGYASLGCKSLRLSNAVTSGSFGDQTFSYSAPNEAGEASSTSGGQSAGPRQNHYEAQFDIASTKYSYQPGLAVSVSPDRGDGSRMSYLRFTDTLAGTNVVFYDTQGISNPANFVSTDLGTLTRALPHSVKFTIDYVNGPSNDVVKIYLDGVLAHTGTTWENYYRNDTEASAEQTPRTTDSLIFRPYSPANPALAGYGFLFDNVVVATSTVRPSVPANGLPNNSYTQTNNFDFTWDASTGISPLTYEFQSSLNPANSGGVLTTGVWPSGTLTGPTIHSSGAPDGTWFWQVRAKDANGLFSAWSSIWQMTIDTHAPATPTDLQLFDNQNKAITSGFTSSYDVIFKWSGSADTEHYVYKYWTDALGSPYSSMDLAYTVNNVTSTSLSGVFNQGEGTHYLTVAACDSAGNCSPYSTPTVVTYDATLPVVKISSPTTSQPINTTKTGNMLSISGTATDTNFNYYYCYVTGAGGEVGVRDPLCQTAWALGTTSKTAFAQSAQGTSAGLLGKINLGGISDGSYVIHVIAKDKAGNSTEATMPFVLDNTAPVVTNTLNVDMLTGDKVTLAPVVTGGAGAIYTWTVSASKLLNDPNDTLDKPTLKIGPAPKGIYTATLTATDPAGNVGTVVYNVTITTPAATLAPRVLGTNTGNGTNAAATVVAKTVSKNESNPLVLGDSIVALEPVTTVTPTPEAVQNNNGRVQGDNTSDIKTAASSQNFLGLGWWWLPILFIVFGSMWFTFVSLRHKFTR